MATAVELLEMEEEVRASVWDPALLRRLVRYAWPYWRRLVIGLVLVAISSFLAVTPPLLIGALVDTVFRSVDSGPAAVVIHVLSAVVPGVTPDWFFALPAETKLWFFAGVFLAVRLATFFIDWGNTYLLAGLGQRVILDIRMELFGHIHDLTLAWFQKTPIGRLVTRVANDVGALEEMFSMALLTIFKDLGMLTGISVTLFSIDRRLGLIALSVVPFMLVATMVFRRYSRAAYRRWRAALSRLNAFLAERLSGIRVVKLFSLEERNDREQRRRSALYKRDFMKQRRAWAFFRPVATTLSATGIGLVLWFGGGSVLSGAITLGVLVAFLSYAELFFAPIRDLMEKFDVIQGAMTAAERIFAILDERSEITERPDAVEPGRLEGRVEFRDVRFSYLPDEPVLMGVSFVVEPGQTVAVVGHTGAGKSTIINLLCRFYDVQGGAVLVDGRDVRDYRLRALRGNIAVVHQDVFLFAGSLLENIRLRNDTISRERVIAACRAVRADRFIERMPDGYDEELEEGGKTLSAGERQLLSFARALATDPSILVLDEATASVDTHTEELIQAAMRRLTEGRTSLVIAHRLSTIRRADRILVMDRGLLVESGTHEELLARRGTYHRLYRMQFAEDTE